MRSVELFAGAGGLAIGMAKAGFHHAAVIERDHYACETFRENQRHHTDAVEGWPLYEMDARKFDYSDIKGCIDVVSGGPPCQPFSMGGKRQGQRDDRNMFPEAMRAVRELRPKAFIFENVKGLRHCNFSQYFLYLTLQLQHPEITRRKGEKWISHCGRLQQHHTASKTAPTYNIIFDTLNAANFGIAQKRERVFIVGFRSDLGIEWKFPEPSHSEESLFVSKWITGDYWEQHQIATSKRPDPPARSARRIDWLKSQRQNRARERWQTTRDVLCDLPEPGTPDASNFTSHIFIPGARSYVGHTGSNLDEPSKTLKAGYHGVPGGENMLIRDDGSVRYFTVREAARLQTFPDEYEFPGSWSQTMRQLGNAVPVALAEIVAGSVAKSLRSVGKN